MRSNAGYRVSMKLENRGKMVPSGEPRVTPVRYTMEVNGSEVRLNRRRGRTVAQHRGTTDDEGDRLEVRFIIGSLAGGKTGNYGDNITITVKSGD